MIADFCVISTPDINVLNHFADKKIRVKKSRCGIFYCKISPNFLKF